MSPNEHRIDVRRIRVPAIGWSPGYSGTTGYSVPSHVSQATWNAPGVNLGAWCVRSRLIGVSPWLTSPGPRKFLQGSKLGFRTAKSMIDKW